MKKPTLKEVFTIPNLLSYLRLILIPVFCWVYLTSQTQTQYNIAIAIVLISSLTDLFDGWIARTFHQVTELGKVLDPVADKLTHAALALCLAVKHPLMWALIALMAVKEGYMGIMGIKFLKKGKMLDGAMWFGKVCTATLFVGLMVLFVWHGMPDAAVNVLIVLMMAVMLATLLMYVPQFKKMEEESVKSNR